LSLCRQQKKESLRDYYKKFLLLKSQLPIFDDKITIHYAISGLRACVLYNHCTTEPSQPLGVIPAFQKKNACSKELHHRKVEFHNKTTPTKTAAISSN
jgi:hypothetical protein